MSRPLEDEKTISVATFRRSGAAVATPTWVVPLDGGRLGFWTSSRSGKAKRLHNNPAVTITPCSQRGKVAPGAPTSHGTATTVTAGPDFEAIQARVRAKYGMMVPLSRFFNTVGHLGRGPFPYGDLGIVVELDTPATG